MPPEPSSPVALVLVCRRPLAGQGKQRLATQLGPGPALEIATGLLRAALEDAADWPGPVILAPAAADDEPWARGLLGRPVSVLPQGPGNLGQRLAGLDQGARAAGHRLLIYVGSDAPVLGPADYAAARTALDHHDVVLQPALDGGVTLMGSRWPWPCLDDLPWSSDRLHGALDARCRAAGQSVATLPVRFDVDVADDLPRLARALASDPRPARQALYRTLAGLGYAAQPEIPASPS